MTTRGAKEDMMHLIAELIEEVLNAPRGREGHCPRSRKGECNNEGLPSLCILIVTDKYNYKLRAFRPQFFVSFNK